MSRFRGKIKKWFLSTIIAVMLMGAMFINSYAWFSDAPSAYDVYTINANGFLYVSATADTSSDRFSARAAKAKAGAVAGGMYMDVLRLYNPLDSNPSYIDEVAQLASVFCHVVVNNEDCPIMNIPLTKAFVGLMACPDCNGDCFVLETRENVTTEVECSTCSGSGKVPCTSCNGSVKCDTCNGSGLFGNEYCPDCRGYGLDPCSTCAGRGVRYATDGRTACPICHGSGFAVCSCGFEVYPVLDWSTGKYQIIQATEEAYEFRHFDLELDEMVTETRMIKKEFVNLPAAYASDENYIYDWIGPVAKKNIVDFKYLNWRAKNYWKTASGDDEFDELPVGEMLYTTTLASQYYFTYSYHLSDDTYVAVETVGYLDMYNPYDASAPFDTSSIHYRATTKSNHDILWNTLGDNRQVGYYTPDDWVKDYVLIPDKDGSTAKPIQVTYKLYFKETDDVALDDYFDENEIKINEVRVYNSRKVPALVTPLSNGDYISGNFESYQTDEYLIEIDYYLAYPDELIDPRLINGSVFVYVEITAKQVE